MNKKARDAYNNLSRRAKNLAMREAQKQEVKIQLVEAKPNGHWCPMTRMTTNLASGDTCPECFAVAP